MPENANHLAAEIGSRIALRRKQLGLTQEQAAERSGLSHQFFACVERGIKSIRAESIIKISKAMGISADYILTGQSSDIDRTHLLALLEQLDEKQLKCMEDVIKSFVTACSYSLDAH